ncbi:hypothetical protein K227x_21780 [Rubripirellula lacrimiformis]|uniref:Uncharacterized protein n=1 Tax=Rubripirellula lacrimiformis TaxID=1930273 RepID=A0A517N9I1_9BACT|nr:hypothetical protein [Rubripirellula lacrimiformis]QDT03793.1 hypothetical protein K227x_21780 [Rubripirellula lacrimiformis]
MNAPAPPTFSDHSATRRMMACLRMVVVIECFGLGGRYLFSSFETESDIYGWLYFDCHWSETVAQAIDNGGALATLVAGGLLCVTGWWMGQNPNGPSGSKLVRWLDRAAASWIAIWMLLLAAAHMMRAAVFAELALPEHAVRYAAPLALAVCGGAGWGAPLKASAQLRRTSNIVLMLTVAAACTFAAHGYKAYQCYAPFTDLILLSDMQWTDTGCTQATAEQVLVVIGIADIIVALVLLVFRSRWAAFYMVVWGFVTAASRMTALGSDAWPETLIRIANGGVPLALLAYWMTSQPPPPTATTPTPPSD